MQDAAQATHFDCWTELKHCEDLHNALNEQNEPSSHWPRWTQTVNAASEAGLDKHMVFSLRFPAHKKLQDLLTT